MKKILLSIGVIAAFVIYALNQKNENNTPVIAPKSLASSSPSSGTSINPTPNSSGSMMNHGQMMGGYKDGSYTGDSVDAFYGYVQVKAVISGGKISDVKFLDYPHDRNNSIRINNIAMPYLTQEAVSAQNANVDIISGATATSEAFQQSLQSALSQAQ